MSDRLPLIYENVDNWWYHFYSQGVDEKIEKLRPSDFALSYEKCTPNFAELIYDYGICHPQIGASITPKQSIVLMKTTVGCTNAGKGHIKKSPYIVGYFRVGKIDKKSEIIFMDPSDSLLLLDNPIKLDSDFAKKLFAEKEQGYWDDPELFVRRLGSTLRNRKARSHEIKLVLTELISRKENGTLNFLGKRYEQLTS